MINIIKIYLLVYISVFLHEVSHYCVAKKLNLEIEMVQIGYDWLCFKIGKWRISPFIGPSYVSTTIDSIMLQSAKNKCIYFLKWTPAS